MTETSCSLERFTAEAIAARLTTRYVGRTLEVYDEIDSTNRRAVALARQGAPSGTAVLANGQSAGRGRLGRRWVSPAGASLPVSVVLRADLAPLQAQRLAMIVSLAMVGAIHTITGLDPAIKWPNDLLLDGHKLGGMLTELGLKGKALDYAVVGIGVNVNLDAKSLAAEIADTEALTTPASLSDALGRSVSRVALAAAFLNALEGYLDQMASGWSPHTVWREHLDTLGKSVHVGTGDEVIHGVATDVDADGRLLVRQADGVLRSILVGDVSGSRVTLRGHIVKQD